MRNEGALLILPVLIHNSNKYDIVDEKTGVKNEGISLTYTMLGEAENTPERKGNEPVKGTIPVAQNLELKAVPGYYQMQFTMGTVKNAQGRASAALKPVAIRFVAPFAGFADLPDTGKLPLPNGAGVATTPANPGGRVAA